MQEIKDDIDFLISGLEQNYIKSGGHIFMLKRIFKDDNHEKYKLRKTLFHVLLRDFLVSNFYCLKV